MPLLGTTTTQTPTNVSDAAFRAWGSAFSAKLLAAGLVQTADTGQINWTTVLTPAGTQAAQGYEIWRFNDALQATAPVYFKIEFGSGAAALNPSIWMTFGSGSNGSGTLTGPTSLRLQSTGTAYATNALSCFWCGDTNRFVAALFCIGTGASSSISQLISFERTVDANGSPTNEGVLWTIKSGSGGWLALAWSQSTGNMTVAAETTLGAMGPSSGNGASGSSVAVYPIFHQKGIFLNPGLNMLVYFDVSFGAGVPNTFTYYGSPRTFVPVGQNAIGGASNTLARAVNNVSVMVRYDT